MQTAYSLHINCDPVIFPGILEMAWKLPPDTDEDAGSQADAVIANLCTRWRPQSMFPAWRCGAGGWLCCYLAQCHSDHQSVCQHVKWLSVTLRRVCVQAQLSELVNSNTYSFYFLSIVSVNCYFFVPVSKLSTYVLNAAYMCTVFVCLCHVRQQCQLSSLGVIGSQTATQSVWLE